MAKGIIPPFKHRCIIQSGDLAGNTYSYKITTSDVEYEMPCQNCGGVTTERQLVLHIYAHLTGEN